MLGTFIDPGLLWAVLLCLWPVVMVGMLGAGGCCATCDICSDDFGRADGSDIDTGSACGWTESSGSAEISSGEMKVTSSNAFIACNSVGDSGSANFLVRAKVSGDNTGDQVRLWIKESDGSGDSGWFAQLTIGTASALAIYSRSGGGAPTIQATTVITTSAGTDYEMRFCVQGRRFNVTVAGKGGVTYTHGSDPANNHRAGVGTGTITSAVYFDDFSYEYVAETSLHEDCDQCGPCSACNFETEPETIQIDIGGGAGTSFDGTYFTEYRWASTGDPATGDACQWGATSIAGEPWATCCLGLQDELRVSLAGTQAGVAVYNGVSPMIVWQLTGLSNPKDCSATRVCPLAGNISCSGGGCSATGSSATITAL